MKVAFTLIFTLSLFLSSQLRAQTFFYASDIFTTPANPSCNDTVYLHVAGGLSSTGEYIALWGFEMTGNQIALKIDAASSGPGLTVIVPDTVTFELGLLSAGTYEITAITGDYLGVYVDSSDYFFTVDCATGITQPETSGLRVFPNPSQSVLNLDVPANYTGKTLQVFNQLGTLVLTQTVLAERQEIDITGLPAGVYVLRVGEDKSSPVRFVKY